MYHLLTDYAELKCRPCYYAIEALKCGPCYYEIEALYGRCVG